MKISITRRELFEEVKESITGPIETFINICINYINQKYSFEVQIDEKIRTKLVSFRKLLRSKYQDNCRVWANVLKYENEWLDTKIFDEELEEQPMEWTCSTPVKRPNAGIYMNECNPKNF